MSKPIGFSAFLKLLELTDARRHSELKKKLNGKGGFQYWRPLQIVAPKAIRVPTDADRLATEIETLCSDHQREHNKNAFAAFCKWIKGKTIEPAPELPAIEVPFGSSGLVIKLKPDVSFVLNSKLYSMNIWATTKPILTSQTLSIGLFFCASAYRAQGHEDYKHAVLDTISNQLFQEENVLPRTIHLMKDKVDAFKRDWDALNKTPPSSPTRPTDQPGITK